MPGIYVGTSEVKNIYVGTTPVKEVYVGTTKVRPTITERPDLDQYSLLGIGVIDIANIHGIAISRDGTKLYAGPASGTIKQYTLTGGLITGISGVESRINGIYTRGLYVKPNGSRLYSVSDNARGYNITMSTPFSLTGSSPDYAYINNIVDNNNPVGVWFTPEGDYFYTCRNKKVHKVKVNTAWDIISYTATGSSDVSLNEPSWLYNVAISPTGLKMFTGGENYIYQYNLSTPRDITTATYSGKSLAITGRATFSVADNGDIFQTPTDNTYDVYQYRAS